MSTESFQSEVIFNCQPEHIYEALTEEKYVTAFTRASTKIEAKVGGKFSMFGGSISGEFVELTKPTHIVQKWRFDNWTEGCFSTVDITLTATSPTTCKLVLKHSGIPEADKFGNSDVPKRVQSGWEQHFWANISHVFGYQRRQ